MYDALLEALTQGQTIISAANFSTTFKSWSHCESGQSELHRQFEMLQKFSPKHKKGDVKDGLQKENVHKNRDVKLAASKYYKMLH